MSTALGGNILGYELTDILDVAGSSARGSLLGRFHRGFADFTYILKLRSHLLNEYFERMSLSLKKNSFRLVLFYHSLLLSTTMIGMISMIPFGSYRFGGILLYCDFFLTGLFTLLTVFNFSANTYAWLSISFTSMVGLSILIHFGTISVSLPIHNTLLSLLVFIVYTHLPVSLAFSVAFSFLLYTGFAMLETFTFFHDFAAPQITLALDQMDNARRVRTVSTFCFYLIIATTCLALYLKIFISLRFKASFLRACQAVHMNAQQKKALVEQTVWIDAVMPKKIRVKYWQLLKQHRDVDKSLWVFCETYDPVSILFSEISGFTTLLDSLSASNLLFLLNSLFSKFDNLCYNCGCERIGTLGSIYYCVSGCPSPRIDHAECCANLALLMMDVVGGMKYERQVELALSVSIHTGNVNGALVGMDRFRFDIYSYSVLTAQKLLATCPSGHIHISSEFERLLPASFKTSPAQPITVKREVQSAIAGMKLIDVPLSTYYLDVDSERLISVGSLRRSPETKAVFRLEGRANAVKDSKSYVRQTIRPRKQSFSWYKHIVAKKSEFAHIRSDTFTKTERPPSSMIWNVDAYQDRKFETIREFIFGIPAENQDIMSQLVENKEMDVLDNEVIKEMHADSRYLSYLFNPQLLNPLTLKFRDAEIEKMYKNRNENQLTPVYIDSLKLAPAFDTIFLYIYILLFTAAYISATAKEYLTGILISALSCVAAVLLALPGIILINYAIFKRIPEGGRILGRFLRLGKSRIFIELVCLVIGQLPTAEIVLFLYFISPSKLFRPKDGFIMFFAPVAILIHCLPVDSPHIVRCVSSAVSTVTLFLCILFYAKFDSIRRSEYAWFYDASIFQPYTLASLMSIITAWILVVFVARSNEATCRLRFYMVMEVERAADTTARAMRECDTFINNVIPMHVVRSLLAEGAQTLNINSVNHAALVPQVGIAFIRLTNFFNSYYREDYHSGKHAIGLLNQIICMFDRRLRRPEYKDVEKLKTYNDSYMVAAGLDLRQREQNSDQAMHLLKLLRFCYGLFKLIKKFNEKFILGQDNAFELGIGVDVGPVCAGLIGSAQPYYHVIGRPADIAYLLHLTSPPGKIAVTDNVRVALISHFHFEEAVLPNPPRVDQSYYYCV
ncbi:Adenylate cyclase type 9 [Echinococcus granulosus]|uniref:adenylate cyclase n=1 Tax=Echinococcus granulosus TaxID=6210 RepID=W6URZ1_ECHGR|nr:Adenylate cyclase type [Echinococcus granulosus]EUB64013.1 Adenylate cyclase type [Echinococcus granulosus]KAH9280676.1 Adenylate cyclase type 9 [Echinococcus granulosus]